jgi:hypothetical protein
LAALAIFGLLGGLLSPRMAGAGTLSGRVLTSLPPAAVTVEALDLASGAVFSVNPLPDGSFRIDGLPEGRFALRALRPGRAGAPVYHAVRDAGSAPLPIPLSSGASVGGILLQLPADPAELPATLTFRFYPGEYYNNKPTEGTANPVSVTAPAATTGIDFGLVRGGGSLSGTVTAEQGGAPLQGVLVTAVAADPEAGFLFSFDVTDANGDYRITALAPGNYVVSASTASVDYLAETYDNVHFPTPGTPVAVAAGADTPNIDIALATAGSISGRVTADAGGAGLEGQTVLAFGVQGTGTPPITAFDGGAGFTDAAGNYVIHGLAGPPGAKYRVQVLPVGNYIGEYYNNVRSANLAAQVDVAAGSTTPNINFGVATGGSITGTITETGTGIPLAGINVSASEQTFLGFGSGETDAQGHYSIPGLVTGSYTVFASEINEWYLDATSPEFATPVVVTEGQVTPNIDMDGVRGGEETCFLPPEEVGSISGRVTEAVGGAGIGDAVVSAHWVEGEFTFEYDFARTLSNGNYTIPCLPPGTYRVVAYYPDSTYLPEWYSEMADSANATDVVVAAGAAPGKGPAVPAVSGVNFTLAKGGSIRGRVTDDVNSQGIPYAPVYARVVGGDADFTATTLADSLGNYVLSSSPLGGLKSGSWIVWVPPFNDALFAYTPVVLAGFRASVAEGAVLLTWETTSEDDHAGFHVERAVAGGAFQRLTAGLLRGPSPYSWRDASVALGETYSYRLAAVSRSGETEFFGPVSVTVAPVLEARLLPSYPNPYRSGTNIAFDLPVPDDVTIRIYDGSGRLVRTIARRFGEGRNAVPWNGRTDGGEAVASGVYLYRVTGKWLDRTAKLAVIR